MSMKKLFLAVAAVSTLGLCGAAALAYGPGGPRPQNTHPAADHQKPGMPPANAERHGDRQDADKRDHGGQPSERSGVRGQNQHFAAPPSRWHDRYWRPGFKNPVPHDRVFKDLRRHHYTRFDGAPHFVNGRYVVKSWRGKHAVFVEVNPYTGVFIGEVRF